MDKHTIVSLLIAFWPLWVGIIVTFVVGWIEERER